MLIGIEAQPRPLFAQVGPEGTEIFRRVLHGKEMRPIEDFERLRNHPGESLLIILGDTDVLDRLPGGLEEFLRNGGAALIATDRKTGSALGSLGIQIIGTPVTIDSASRYAYLESSEMIHVREVLAERELFGGLNRIATNKPSYLTSERDYLPVLAAFPPGARVTQRRFEPFVYAFAAGGDVGSGRLLVLADHSVFINGMLWQPDNHNLSFAYRCADWLSQGRRSEVLFVEEGIVKPEFNLSLDEPRPVPLPTPEQAVGYMNEFIHELEQENSFNNAIRRAMYRFDWENIGKTCVILATIALAVYGLTRLGQGKHRQEVGLPSLESATVQVVPAVNLLEMRRRSVLRSGNYWEVARSQARTRLAAMIGKPFEPLEAAWLSSGKRRPPFDFTASWWDKLNLKRKVQRIWDIATRQRGVNVSRGRLKNLQLDMQEIESAIAEGRVRIIEPADSRRTVHVS